MALKYTQQSYEEKNKNNKKFGYINVKIKMIHYYNNNVKYYKIPISTYRL